MTTRTLRRALLLFLLFSQSACLDAAGKGAPREVGNRVAFDYHPLSPQDVEYLSRFQVVVTHDVADRRTVKALKAHGARLFFYEWLPALYYTDQPGPWERLVYQSRAAWTLDPEDRDPNPMGDKFGCKDFFYDMADAKLREARVEHLVRKTRAGGYDGIFFDWGSGRYSLTENGYRFATDAFDRRHPGAGYDQEVNLFLARLKEKGVRVILNGAFRSQGGVLGRHADLDVVESMFTSESGPSPFPAAAGKEGAAGRETGYADFERSLELAVELPQRARGANPGLRLLFLNYAQPFYRKAGDGEAASHSKAVDRQALFYGQALSYLGGASGFTAGADVSLDHVKDDLFFCDLGAPAGELLRLGRDGAMRRFRKGLVVAARRKASWEIAVPSDVRGVRDLYQGVKLPLREHRVRVTLEPEQYASGKSRPMGRIYIYEY